MRNLAIKPILLNLEKEFDATYKSTTTRAKALLSLIGTYQFNHNLLNDTKETVKGMNLIEEIDLSQKILNEYLRSGSFNQIQSTMTKQTNMDKELFKSLCELLEEIVTRKDSDRAVFLD